LIIETGGSVTTNASGVSGNGGNVTIAGDATVVFGGGTVQANGTVDGGKLAINTYGYFAFPGSIVTATGGTGKNGTVDVSADTSVTAALAALSDKIVPVDLTHIACASSAGTVSSVVRRGPGGLPFDADGPLPNYYSDPRDSATILLPTSRIAPRHIAGACGSF